MCMESSVYACYVQYYMYEEQCKPMERGKGGEGTRGLSSLSFYFVQSL